MNEIIDPELEKDKALDTRGERGLIGMAMDREPGSGVNDSGNIHLLVEKQMQEWLKRCTPAKQK